MSQLFKEVFFANYAEAIGLTPESLWKALIDSVFPKTIRVDRVDIPYKPSAGDVISFLRVAQKYKLDPFMGQIYPVPKKGGVGIKPSIYFEGYSQIMTRHPQFNGIEISMAGSVKDKSLSCTAKVWRKDCEHPTTITEYYEECAPEHPKAYTPWGKSPRRQLRHKAITQIAKIVFGVTEFHDTDDGKPESFQSVMEAHEPPRLAPVSAEDRIAEMLQSCDTVQEAIDVELADMESNEMSDIADSEMSAEELAEADLLDLKEAGTLSEMKDEASS